VSTPFYTDIQSLRSVRDMTHRPNATLPPPETSARREHPLSSRENRPPGPRLRFFGIPFLRTLRQDYLGVVRSLHARYGDIAYMHVLHEHVFDLFTPALVREALVDNADHLIRWERGVDVFAEMFGRSVLTTEGATWRRQRRMLAPAFAPKRIAGYAALMRDAIAAALDVALPADDHAGTVDMDALFSRMTMDVILRTLFSERASAADVREAADATRTLADVAMREMFWPVALPAWLPLRSDVDKRRALHTLHELVARRIRDRRAQPDSTAYEDLLARLLALRDEDTGAALGDDELRDQCMVIFQAGHETTATALLWWSRLMAEYPTAAKRAVQEVDAVLQSRPPLPDDLAALPWLTATLKEAMRLYAPTAALLARRTTRDMQLGGWHIPRGAMLRITLTELHRDPSSFADPEAFRPERFLPDATEPPRGAWLPFGVGPRVCIGHHFAMLEMTMAAAMLLQRVRLELPDNAPAREPVFNVTLRPREPVHLRLVRLRSSHHATRRRAS
jgi:cytochrome P450